MSPLVEPGAGDAGELRERRRVELIATEGPEGRVSLRFDQMLSARFWGIGFTFADEEVADVVAGGLVRAAVRALAAGLRGLEQVERVLGSSAKPGEVHIIAPRSAREFEQLMLDVLNESGQVARRAPFKEDFFEKTDLRFKPPDLARKRGARIQVTATVDPSHHEAKVSGIRLAEEFVILSPLLLAHAVGPGELLSHADHAAFWRCFHPRPAEVGVLAVAIRQRFRDAIAARLDHPLGPMAAVPESLRRLVCAYVTAETFRSTEQLREREARAAFADRPPDEGG
jgi:hypothetical protein